MNTQQALVVSDLGTSNRPPSFVTNQVVKKASIIAERVFALSEQKGKSLRGNPESWRKEELTSARFFLLEMPLHSAACQQATDRDKLLGCLRAAADSIEPIVVDLNKNKINQSTIGFYPKVVVVDGTYRHTASRMQGHTTIRAWVGELAAQSLGLIDKDGKVVPQRFAKHNDDTRKRAIAAAAAETEKIATNFRHYQVGSLEASMRIFGAAGGMGGPSSSLGQGSGPGPSMVMKPKPSPGNTTMQSDVDIEHKEVDLHERPPKKKNPALKATGYEGYKDATDKERQRMKAPKGSEFEDPKTRNKTYSSDPDVDDDIELKGAAKTIPRIVTKFKAAVRGGYKPSMEAVAPPGMEHTVKGLKKHFPKGSASPFKLAWFIHNKKKGKQ